MRRRVPTVLLWVWRSDIGRRIEAQKGRDVNPKKIVQGLLPALAALLAAGAAQAKVPACDRACLQQVAVQYRAAYLAHDPGRAPFAAKVRFTENNVEMRLPDGTWDTVSREVGPALTVADPETGNVGVFTSVMQNDVPGFLAIRLKVKGRKIVEVEHVIATRRYLAPPVSIGDVEHFVHDPDFEAPVPPRERMGRADLIRLADGYFGTLERNDGTLRTRFAPDVRRLENGTAFPDVEKGFRNGFYRFNDRVRDRDFFLVDEERGVVMARAFIDHKGLLGRYRLNDGVEARSPYSEPQTWSLIEMFRISGGQITAIETIFVQVPYYMRSPWAWDSEAAWGRRR